MDLRSLSEDAPESQWRGAHLAEAAALQGRFWPMHELLFGHQQALEDAPTCWATPTSSGWTVTGSPLIWMPGPSGSGSRPTPTAPSKAAPKDPDPVHQRPAKPGRLRPGDPERGPGRRQRGAMTMAVCLHLHQLRLAFVAATGGMDMRLISAQALKEKLDRGDP